jgi:hypothetical protein
MTKFPIRRAQLIAPFGVGAMLVIRDGTSVITAGLDHWYKREDVDTDSRDLDDTEYIFEEWRLQKFLNVDHFRLPPDFRPSSPVEQVPNTKLTIPFLRFPSWHFCPRCKYLCSIPLSVRGKQKCDICAARKKISYLVQVPFVAMCDHGHIQDFPWREWVHKSINPSCRSNLKLIATGGASLSAQQVVCDCGAKRSLASITNAYSDGRTELSQSLEPGGQPYLCFGLRPWLNDNDGEGCGRNIRGSLRSASNVYFAEVRSAIYLPRSNEDAPSELVELLENPPLSTVVKYLLDMKLDNLISSLRGLQSTILQDYTDKQIEEAIKIIKFGKVPNSSDNQPVSGDSQETSFRRDEFRVLRTSRNETQLTIEEAPLQAYQSFVRTFFSRIMLIPRLQETRVLAGFTRILTENDQTPEQRRALLWKVPPAPEKSWLPAYKVYGEGIFLELNEEKLQEWEQQERVQQHLLPITKKYRDLQLNLKIRERPIGPRFLLLHTLAHLIMNQLTFECGYSSASLRERLYVSDNRLEPMAGILIYTAAGDAEGSLGGLVRMGKPGYLEPAIQRALEGARWCSADPVCMESISQGGQGPDSCNLAACHSCALVPETACEEFNRFLDRAVVVGSHTDDRLGFFRTLDENI